MFMFDIKENTDKLAEIFSWWNLNRKWSLAESAIGVYYLMCVLQHILYLFQR